MRKVFVIAIMALFVPGISAKAQASYYYTPERKDHSEAVLSFSPSFQRIYWGDGSSAGAYNAMGGSVKLYYSQSLFNGGMSLRTGAVASLRFPLGLGSRRPDVSGALEVGLEMGTKAFRVTPEVSVGYGLLARSKGTFGALGVELSWRTSRKVSLFVEPKVYFPAFGFIGGGHPSPSLDAGLKVRLWQMTEMTYR